MPCSSVEAGERILAHVTQHGSITKRTVMDLCGTSSGQALLDLRKLTASGALKRHWCDGDKPHSVWTFPTWGAS